MSMNFKEALDGLRNTHDRVVVFTQNEAQVWDYLLHTSGRFEVGYNKLYWDRKEDDRIVPGTLLPGYKVGLNDGCGGNVGLDCAATDLIFTRNPFFPISKKDGILKDEFRFAPLQQRLDLRPLDAINQLKPIAIKFNNFNDLIRVHDFMTVNKMEHSIQGQEELPVHLIKKVVRVGVEKYVFFNGGYLPEELIPYWNCTGIYLNHEMEFHYPDFLVVKEILKVFHDFPESGLSTNFLAFRLHLSPRTIEKSLEFLTFAGCLQRAYVNNDHVTIHKGYITKPDKIFSAIPEGTSSIAVLLKRLNVPRETLIPILEHYSGKGLNYSYVPRTNEDVYRFVSDLKNEDYSKACEAIQYRLSFMSDWLHVGPKFLNQWMDRKIEKHCLENKSQAVLFAVGQATSINFSSSQQNPLGS